MSKETPISPENQKSTTSVTRAKRSPGKVGKLILKNKLSFSLLFALIVVFVWGQWQIGKKEKEKQSLVKIHQIQTDSIQSADYLLVSKVFSWIARSDMMRNNFDQASQYMLKISKEPNITKAYIINTDNSTIILSSLQEEVGKPVIDIALLQTEANNIQQINGFKRFVIPISGLNRKIGLAVIETTLK